MLSLRCLSALLLFGPFAGQRKRGLRVGVCCCNYRRVRRSSSILFNWTGKNDHGLNIVAIVVDSVAAFSFVFNTPENGLGEDVTANGSTRRRKTSPRVRCFGSERYNRRYVHLQHAAAGTGTGSWVGCESVDG